MALAEKSAVLDAMHVGDIHGALGTIGRDDLGPRKGWWAKFVTFLAILGPGLIVMAGDNDAGAFSVYSQAGQDYGARLVGIVVVVVGAVAMISLRHSLHRSVTDAPVFYGVYALLIAVAAALVVTPGVPLGLLTNAVQVLAGVLLPSATVFLLLLCNDKAVLGPWSNTRRVNVFTGFVIAVLLMLSVILTGAVLFPSMGTAQILWILGIGSGASVAASVWMLYAQPRDGEGRRVTRGERDAWRMPPLSRLPKAALTPLNAGGLFVLRAYLGIAVILVVVRVAQIATHTAQP